MPYRLRFGFFLLLLSLIALYDLFRNRSRARKWREYSFLLLGGACGALFGAINDLAITSRISPDYFVLGKAIPGGEGFRERVLLLGLQAGLGPGIIGGAFYLYMNTRKREVPSIPFPALIVHLGKPLVGAAGFALLLPLCFSSTDPMGFRFELRGLLTPDETARFLKVWWIHCGIYFGLLVGLLWGAASIQRGRRRLAEPAEAKIAIS